MSIYTEETQKNSNHFFNALAGYLQNMLASKEEIDEMRFSYQTELMRVEEAYINKIEYYKAREPALI